MHNSRGKSVLKYIMDPDRQTPVTSRSAAAQTPDGAMATSAVALPKMVSDGNSGQPKQQKIAPKTATGVAAGITSGPVGATPTVKDQYAFLEKTKPTKEIKRWSKEQDSLLTVAVKEFGEKNWKAIADRVPDRTDSQCLHRWTKVLNPR